MTCLWNEEAAERLKVTPMAYDQFAPQALPSMPLISPPLKRLFTGIGILQCRSGSRGGNPFD